MKHATYLSFVVAAVFAGESPVIIEQIQPNFCQKCVETIQPVIDNRRNGSSNEKVREVALGYCSAYEASLEACKGILDIQMPTILYILDNKPDLTAQRACAIYFQFKNCSDPSPNNWSIDIPPKKDFGPPKKVPSSLEGSNAKSLRLLHLTDFHYDPDYVVGSNAVCSAPLCCQKDSGAVKAPEDAAGYWGDYRVCDIPWHSVLNVLAQINKQHRSRRSQEAIDYIYYTGDIIPHTPWKTTVESNKEIIKRLFSQFAKSFEGIPLYPVLGNHESHPTNYYSPKNVTGLNISTNWLFRLAAEEWTRWLPVQARATILKGGYYTVLAKPGFRIIALNSNVCFTYNIWLIYDDTDPYDQLKWLVDVLTEAEKNGEHVHILSHVPPGSIECIKNWNKNYIKIVERFSHVIKAQFNGHTHMDEIRFFYDGENKDKVTNVAYNGASLTTFIGYNPNYRVYDLKPETYDVLDYEQWTFNLTAANLNPKKSPDWYKIYSLKEAYGLPDLSGESLANLVKKMEKDQSLVQKYYEFLGRNSEPQIRKGCDKNCLNTLLCSITAVDFENSIDCGIINQ